MIVKVEWAAIFDNWAGFSFVNIENGLGIEFYSGFDEVIYSV